MFRAVEEIAGGGDGDAPFQWFESADLVKFLALTSVIQWKALRICTRLRIRLVNRICTRDLELHTIVPILGFVRRTYLGIVVFLGR